MPPNQLRTQMSDTHTHTGRRRHAAPRDPSWARRAGLVGGVVSALALCSAAAPAMAENTHGHHKHSSASTRSAAGAPRTATALSDATSARQAAAVFEQSAVQAQITAAQAHDAAVAAKAAAAQHAAQIKAAKAAAAAKAARERAAAQAASRSSARAALTVTPTASPSATPTASASTTAAPASSSKVDQLISFLKAQLGKPYVYGATGPGSYDCSGLTQAAFASVGVTLPRTSQEQSTAGTPVSVSALRAGDLIFWGGEGSAYHVGVYIGDGQYLDAANPSTPVAIHQLADYMPDWAVRVL